MRLAVNIAVGQAILLICAFTVIACNGKKEEVPVIPPVTAPLSGNYIGFGVITVSYTHISGEPEEGSASLGYMRGGAVVQVLERKTVTSGKSPCSWVLIQESQRGWLKEEVMDIYDNESRAKTAAQSMSR